MHAPGGPSESEMDHHPAPRFASAPVFPPQPFMWCKKASDWGWGEILDLALEKVRCSAMGKGIGRAATVCSHCVVVVYHLARASLLNAMPAIQNDCASLEFLLWTAVTMPLGLFFFHLAAPVIKVMLVMFFMVPMCLAMAVVSAHVTAQASKHMTAAALTARFHRLQHQGSSPCVMVAIMAAAVITTATTCDFHASCQVGLSPYTHANYFQEYYYAAVDLSQSPTSSAEWRHWLLGLGTKAIAVVAAGSVSSAIDLRHGVAAQALLVSGLAFGAAQLNQCVKMHPFTSALSWHDDTTTAKHLMTLQTGYVPTMEFSPSNPFFRPQSTSLNLQTRMGWLTQYQPALQHRSVEYCRAYRLANNEPEAQDWNWLKMALAAFVVSVPLTLFCRPQQPDPTAQLAYRHLEMSPRFFGFLRIAVGLAGLVLLSWPSFTVYSPQQWLQREVQLLAASSAVQLMLCRTSVEPFRFGASWITWRLLFWLVC